MFSNIRGSNWFGNNGILRDVARLTKQTKRIVATSKPPLTVEPTQKARLLGVTCYLISAIHQRHWISQQSPGSVKQNHQVTNCQVMTKLRMNRDNQSIAEEMELEAVWGNSQRLFRLMRDTVGLRTSLREAVWNRNWEPIFGRQLRRYRWAESVRGHLSRQPTAVPTPRTANAIHWEMSLTPNGSEISVEQSTAEERKISRSRNTSSNSF